MKIINGLIVLLLGTTAVTAADKDLVGEVTPGVKVLTSTIGVVKSFPDFCKPYKEKKAAAKLKVRNSNKKIVPLVEFCEDEAKVPLNIPEEKQASAQAKVSEAKGKAAEAKKTPSAGVTYEHHSFSDSGTSHIKVGTKRKEPKVFCKEAQEQGSCPLGTVKYYRDKKDSGTKAKTVREYCESFNTPCSKS